MRLIHIACITLVTLNVSAQQTTTWNFICEQYALGGIAQVQIAKSETGGILNLEIETNGNDFYIGGPVYVYLFDNSVITCIDKGIRKNISTRIKSSYLFSDKEMARLKKTDIQSVRFTIKGTPTKFSSQVGNFTAVNKKTYFSGFANDEKNYYLTAAEIAALK